MRLLWAGLLVLLPLVAELATAQKCSGEPDAPENSNIRCFKRKNSCRATCAAGYIFPEKKTKVAVYKCQGGEWVMQDGDETACSPLCDPPCENGVCIEPDTCDCDDGFIGDLCDEEEAGEEEDDYDDYGLTTTDAPFPDPEGYGEDEDLYNDEDMDYEDHEEAHAENEEDPEYGDEDDVEDEEEEGTAEPEPEAVDDEEEDDDHDADGAEDENGDGNGDDDAADDAADDDDNAVDDDAGNNGDDDSDDHAADDDDDDDAPMEAAYGGGASELIPQVLVGTAALLMARAL